VKRDKARLRQEIILLVIIKLIAIAALWWYCVRDARVTVTPTSAAEHLGAIQRSPTLPGETHDQ
jgi:hypothetical protein